jgi:hypothetical protein
LAGVLEHVGRDNWELIDEAKRLVSKVLPKHYAGRFVSYNDSRRRKFEEIDALLTNAIEKA